MGPKSLYTNVIYLTYDVHIYNIMVVIQILKYGRSGPDHSFSWQYRIENRPKHGLKLKIAPNIGPIRNLFSIHVLWPANQLVGLILFYSLTFNSEGFCFVDGGD